MLDIRNINKTYGKNQVLKDISITAESGDCIALIGANGSGKTTLLSIISGIQKADSGEIFIDGTKCNKKNVYKYIAYVPQENPLIKELSVRDNLKLWYTDSETDMEKSLKEGLLKRLGVDEFLGKRVSELSGGMKKRLSIGMALADDPPIIIMDEPSASLDIKAKAEVRGLMKIFTEKYGKIVLIATHDEMEIVVCNRKLYLEKGTIIQKV